MQTVLFQIPLSKQWRCTCVYYCVCPCADSLDGRPITHIERQFLKNWKVMHKVEHQHVAPAGTPASSAQLTELPVCGPKVTLPSAGSRQQSMLVVSARQSASEHTNVATFLLPCSSVSAKQPLYYDSQWRVFSVCHLSVIFTASTVYAMPCIHLSICPSQANVLSK